MGSKGMGTVKLLGKDLHRGGETYPTNNAEMHALFANGEVDMSFTQSPRGAGPTNSAGTTPPTSRAFAFYDNMIGDFNYWAIPYNAPNKAAALVYANLVLRSNFASCSSSAC
jgi:putative spermidine/putrescine transport system substrate-binding protein